MGVALHVGKDLRTPKWVRRYIDGAWDHRQVNRCRIWRGWNPTKAVRLKAQAIVGIIRFAGMHRLATGEARENPWALGPFCWELDRAIPLQSPILDVVGSLGFWKASTRIGRADLNRLKRAIKHADSHPNLGRF